jgi:hypothetical protein
MYIGIQVILLDQFTLHDFQTALLTLMNIWDAVDREHLVLILIEIPHFVVVAIAKVLWVSILTLLPSDALELIILLLELLEALKFTFEKFLLLLLHQPLHMFVSLLKAILRYSLRQGIILQINKPLFHLLPILILLFLTKIVILLVKLLNLRIVVDNLLVDVLRFLHQLPQLIDLRLRVHDLGMRLWLTVLADRNRNQHRIVLLSSGIWTGSFDVHFLIRAL